MDDSALLGLGIQADPQSQQRAVHYFEQLKSAEDGWKLCGNALTSGAYQDNDHVKFFCFQVLEHYLKTRYRAASAAEQQEVKTFLLTWIQLQGCATTKEKTFIRNKAAQVFSLAMVVDYPLRWPAFFTDLLQSLQLGVSAIDMYLRILMAIDTEVVDREVAHTQEDADRNTMIKDAMRVQCVQQLVDSWYHIITTYEDRDPELTCFCLEVIGAYISWIDISLIANDKFVTMLLKFMSNALLRESACDCIHEIISKGMDPVAKMKLIESFITVLENAGLLSVSEDEEGDYLAKLSKLINGIGLQLIQGWQKLSKTKEADSSKLVLDSLEGKVPLMFRFLANEDDDVSGAVAQFAHDYVTLYKQMVPLNEQRKANVKNLLYVIINKMKFDESYNHEQEGEDEAMFLEYRKQLKVIFNNIGALDTQLVLGTVAELVTRTFQQWAATDYADVEVAITLLYILAEALPASHGQYFGADPDKSTALQQMMRLLMSSNVSRYQHPAVVSQFFETVVRYDKFFNQEPNFIPEALMAFLDERGLRNNSAHVRSRTAYLFSRFVKSISKQHLQNYLEDILSRMQDLLVLDSPNNGVKHYLSADDQLFIYETAGVLIVHSNFAPEKKQGLMRKLLAPIVGKYEGLLQSLISETNPKQQLAYAECLAQAVAYASRTSKGFTNQQTMKLCGCVEVYTETLKVFLQALNAPAHRQLLHSSVRQYLHRMVVCLDAEVLPFIPIAMEHLLKNADAKELHDFIPLLNQVVSKFKKHMVPFLQQVFMPVVSTIFQVLNTPLDERDQVAATEKKMLERGYFSFIATLVNTNVTEVLSNQESQNLEQVLLTVIQGAVDIPDPLAQKTCFSILRKLVETWGSSKDGLAGFEDFMYKSIIPACFMAPTKPTFDLGDAQTALVLNECAQCLKSMLNQRGDELIQYLQTNYLPTVNVGPEIAQEFCQALKSDQKVFRTYFKTFCARAKS